MFESFSVKLIEFIVTYFVLSTALLGSVWILNKCRALSKRGVAEAIWKLAFWSPFFVAGFLVFQTRTPGTIPPSSNAAPIEIIQPLASTPTAASTNQVITRKVVPLPEAKPIPVSEEISQVKHRSTPVPIAEQAKPRQFSLPSNFQQYLNYLVCLWLGFVFVIFVRFAIRVNLLNREVKQYPEYQTDVHILSVERRFPSLKNKIHIKLTETWNSPIVAPNNIICIPDWTLKTLTSEQLEVMIAHEVAHILRRDPAWSIAYRFLTCAFFFQPMNRVAERALGELAELACDDMASNTRSEKRSLAEALFACANVHKNQTELPSLALAMAKPNSPLLARVGALIESPSTQSPLYAKLTYGGGVLAVLAISFWIPGIQISFAKMPNANPMDVPRQLPQRLPPNSLRAPTVQEKQLPEQVDKLAIDFTSDTKANDQSNQQESENGSKSTNERAKADIVPLTQTQNKDQVPSLMSAEGALTTIESHANQTQNRWNLEEAKLALKAKNYSEAIDILKHLANNHDVQAQSMLAVMYWFGEGMSVNLDEAEKWSRLAAAKGDHQAIKLVHTIDERNQNRNAISFFTGESPNSHFNYLENKCQLPAYSPSLFASNSVALETWNKCAKKHVEALKTAKSQDQLIIPSNVLAILTEREIKKAEENSSLVIDRAIESIAASKAEMQRGLQAWNEAHPNLITNAPFIPANKLPETVTRTSEYRVSLPPLLLKQTPP